MNNVTIKTYKCPDDAVELLKEFVLQDTFGVSVRGDENQSIEKTNWPDECRDEENDKKFVELFMNNFWNNYVEWFEETYPEFSNPRMINIWYQIYRGDGDSHDWHIHERACLANVIYLELPDPSLGTQFRFNGNHVFTPPVEEGDTLAFNPFYWHRSPENHTGKQKVVVAFNVDYDV